MPAPVCVCVSAGIRYPPVCGCRCVRVSVPVSWYECVSTSVHVHVCAYKVRLRLLCPAPHKHKTEMCRHLRERVPLHFLSGCRARPNAPRAQRESSACRPPYTTVYLRDLQCEEHQKFYLYPVLSSFIFFKYAVLNTTASTFRVVALSYYYQQREH